MQGGLHEQVKGQASKDQFQPQATCGLGWGTNQSYKQLKPGERMRIFSSETETYSKLEGLQSVLLVLAMASHCWFPASGSTQEPCDSVSSVSL